MLHINTAIGMRAPRGTNIPSLRSRTVQTSEGPVDVAETGPAMGPAIVLVTHGLGSLESFEEIALGLATRLPHHRIVTYSRPGTGRTPFPAYVNPGAQLLWEATASLRALLGALDIDRADLVGHSDGAVVAMLFACIHPELVRSLVAVAPQVFADTQFIQATRNLPADEAPRILRHQLGATHADDALAYARWRAAREALCQTPGALLDQIEGLTAPVLFVQGLRDEFGSSNQVSLASGLVAGPVKWVLLQRDGHVPQYDNPEQTLALIENHLARATSSLSGRREASRAVHCM